MKCLEPDCPLTSASRDDPGYCRKHAAERKRPPPPLKAIARVIDDELLLCFPEREVLEGRMRVWGFAGPKTVSELDYLYSAPPRSKQDRDGVIVLISQYQRDFTVTVQLTRAWTAGQKKMCWGLDK